jgi:Tfp pilus assembly protein PilO
MKRLSPAKRNQLIAVVLATIGLICLVYFLMIKPFNEQNEKLALDTKQQRARLEDIKKGIKQAESIAAGLTEVLQQLSHAEEDVATGDVFAWMYDTIRRFKVTYHVDIPSIGQSTVTDVDLIPAFPYKQLRVSLSGSAYYHDLGKFISDFENNFPHMRLVNLAIEPSNQPGGSTERLTFRVDVIALVKPNT